MHKLTNFLTLPGSPSPSPLTGVDRIAMSFGPLPSGMFPAVLLLFIPSTSRASSWFNTLFGHPVLVLSVVSSVLFGYPAADATAAVVASVTLLATSGLPPAGDVGAAVYYVGFTIGGTRIDPGFWLYPIPPFPPPVSCTIC